MGYTASEAKEFIKRIAPLIVSEGKARGYKIYSTVIAQAILEGAAGTSLLAKQYHNHFGLKCGSAWKGASVNMKTKEEYTVGILTTIKDNFRAYANDTEGVKGYYDFIATKRYENLKTAKTYIEYAQMLKADGYATSSTYVNSLCSVVTKYDLTKWDNEVITDEEWVVGRTYTTTSDLYIRIKAAGTKIKFESVTEDGKKHSFYDSYGCAILKKGTRVTCKEVKKLETSTWIRIPSGWICAISGDKKYVG